MSLKVTIKREVVSCNDPYNQSGIKTVLMPKQFQTHLPHFVAGNIFKIGGALGIALFPSPITSQVFHLNSSTHKQLQLFYFIL